MSKAFVITAVDYGDTVDGKARVVGVQFDRNKAQEILNRDMEEYKKSAGPNYEEGDDLSVWEKGGDNGCEWNVEEVNVNHPLTPLQEDVLKILAMNISAGSEEFFNHEKDLSEEEIDYLLGLLKKLRIVIDRENGIELRGHLADEYLKAHGEEGKGTNESTAEEAKGDEEEEDEKENEADKEFIRKSIPQLITYYKERGWDEAESLLSQIEETAPNVDVFGTLHSACDCFHSGMWSVVCNDFNGVWEFYSYCKNSEPEDMWHNTTEWYEQMKGLAQYISTFIEDAKKMLENLKAKKD